MRGNMDIAVEGEAVVAKMSEAQAARTHEGLVEALRKASKSTYESIDYLYQMYSTGAYANKASSWQAYLDMIGVASVRAERMIRFARFIAFYGLSYREITPVSYSAFLELVSMDQRSTPIINKNTVRAWVGYAARNTVSHLKEVKKDIQKAFKAGVIPKGADVLPASLDVARGGQIGDVRRAIVSTMAERSEIDAGDVLKKWESVASGETIEQKEAARKELEATRAEADSELPESSDDLEDSTPPVSVVDLVASSKAVNASPMKVDGVERIEATTGDFEPARSVIFKIRPSEEEVIRAAVDIVRGREGISSEGGALEIMAAEILASFETNSEPSQMRLEELARTMTRTHCRESGGRFMYIPADVARQIDAENDKAQ